MIPAPVVVRVLFALPLVLVLPGFALASALFPTPLRWIERLMVALALSISVCIIGGLVLNWTVMTRVAWTVFLVATTVAAAFFAQWRANRRNERAPGLMAWPRAAHIPIRAALLALCSLGLAAGAVGLARSALPAKGVDGYTTLWLVPAKNPGTIEIGVLSSELRTTSYSLELRAGGERLITRPLTLKTGQEWVATVDVSSSIPVSRRSFEALLYRSSEPQTPYRRVTAVFPGATVPPTTGLWLVPGAPETDTVRVLVTSAELRRTSFRVEVLADGHPMNVARFTLNPGAREVVEVDISSIPRDHRSFEALLYQQGASGSQAPYRRASLWTGSSSS
jgi:Protein of unknown function (DUF1616)